MGNIGESRKSRESRKSLKKFKKVLTSGAYGDILVIMKKGGKVYG